MSTLNPNVFFEFGIRTSLNKAVCVVKDERTEKVPFEAGILNHYTYKSTLSGWEIEIERNLLTKHITSSAKRSKEQNTLWKYFGIEARAEKYVTTGGKDDRLEYSAPQIEFMRSALSTISEQTALNQKNSLSYPQKVLAARSTETAMWSIEDLIWTELTEEDHPETENKIADEALRNVMKLPSQERLEFGRYLLERLAKKITRE